MMKFSAFSFQPSAFSLQLSVNSQKSRKVVVWLLAVVALALMLALLLQYMAWQVDQQCRQYLGWKYYSLFPAPSCHAGAQVQLLSYLHYLFDKVPVDYEGLVTY
jgi:hypothetical protein